MQRIKISYAIALALVSFASYPIPVVSQPTSVSNTANRTLPRFTPPPLPPSGTPIGRRRGAAGRGGSECTQKPPLTALVPATEQSLAEGKATYVWAKTTAEYPTFWFYIPESSSSLNSVEFVLQDEQDNDVYRTPVRLPQKSGIISVRLPSTATALKTNQKYRWFLKIAGEISCNQQNPTLFKDAVEGWVQRVKPDATFASQLETATPQQQVTLYARNGLWYDALTALAKLRLLKPQDSTLEADWNQLLQSINLSDIASQQIVECCNSYPSNSGVKRQETAIRSQQER